MKQRGRGGWPVAGPWQAGPSLVLAVRVCGRRWSLACSASLPGAGVSEADARGDREHLGQPPHLQLNVHVPNDSQTWQGFHFFFFNFF